MSSIRMHPAGLFYDTYPIRDSETDTNTVLHGFEFSDDEVQQIALRGLQLSREFSTKTLQEKLSQASVCNINGTIKNPQLSNLIALFARVFEQHHKFELSHHQVCVSIKLLGRRVECMQNESDRVTVAGLSSFILSRIGLRVHIIGENDIYEQLVRDQLNPVFENLATRLGIILPADSIENRHRAYSNDITFLSAREVALDFLRDAINWPSRGNAAHRSVDRLLGRRANGSRRLHNGLQCAVHLDAQHALIDNARAPILLTESAHPMHETEEVKKALELTEHIEVGADFVYVSGTSGIAFTAVGKQKIESWANSLGGIWVVDNVAEALIAVALVTRHLIVEGQHYRLHKDSIEWLVNKRLVPGVTHYSEDFVTKVLEIKHDCSSSSQQEVVGRASYQHVFNRYYHLSGVASSFTHSRKELNTIYHLNCQKQSARFSPLVADHAFLLPSKLEKNQYILDMIADFGTDAQVLICVKSISEEQTDELLIALEIQGLSCRRVESAQELITQIENKDANQVSITLTSITSILDLPANCWDSLLNEPYFLVTHRDLNWYSDSGFAQLPVEFIDKLNGCSLILSEEDAIFSDDGLANQAWVLQMIRLGQQRIWAQWLAKKILILYVGWRQKAAAQKGYDIRKNLLAHDKGVQSMLSFSGRGLYE